MNETLLTSESTIYVTYIASTPDKVWQALTSSEFTRQFFFGRNVESEWKKGAAWLLRKPDGAIDVTGEIRQCEPPFKLVLSWNVAAAEFQHLPEAIVSYEVETIGDGVVRLTMIEAHPMPIPAHLLDGGRKGWPMILSGLKSLLETGKPLAIPIPQPAKGAN